jgi:spore maturation protein CgeB
VINSLYYIGSLNPNSNSFRRFETYKQLISNVKGIDIDQYIYKSATRKFDHHLNFGLGTLKLNCAVRAIDFSNIDLVLVDNRPFLFSKTLQLIRTINPNVKIALVLTDDPNGKFKSGWRLLKTTAPFYDIHFVQRVVNVAELLSWGAKNVELCFRSYDPLFHRKKSEIEKNQTCDVGFIGSYEEQREEYIKFLIDNGIKVQVIGDGWDNGRYFDFIKPFYCGPSVYGECYVDFINSMKIALHFLRVGNRDEQDSRTFEIPACGIPMIAQYSSVHASLFSDDEVLYFNTNHELLEKVRYFLENPEIAAEFAKRAEKRCIVSGYDHKNTIKRVIEKIGK